MANQVMRITLKAYEHQLVDASAKKIIETVKKDRSSGERSRTSSYQEGSCYHSESSTQVQGLQRTVRAENSQETDRHHAPTQKTVDALQRLEMPAGVYIDIKMKNN